MLSGGLDSAIIQAVAHCPTCYTVTFPGVADNLTPALGATRGAQLFPVSFGLAEAQQALPRVAYHLDTPAMWTAVCQWWMMQAIAADGFRICLSGEGADELFLGYSRYRILWWLEQARQDERLHSYGPMLDHVVGSGAGAMARMIQRGYGLVSSARATEVIKRFDDPALSLPRRMAKIDFSTGMQVLLRMADRMAAAHSLENRSPFLDHRVIELAARLPDSALIDAGRSKAVLIEVARRLDVPEEILQEKTKRGLYLPWNTWHPKAQTGPRGAWDRRHFHNAMLHAWREAFAGRRSQACDAAASEEDQQACDTPRS
jgi:asparagine synthase (glutamine-hydrolysing)